MNKHLFLSVVAACSLMLTTACSDEDPTISSGDTAKVSFNLQADAALSTRAISDGNGADMLVYRVFDKDGNIISGQAKKTESGLTDLKTGHNITLNLAKGQTYKVAFWAQDADCSAYTVAEDMSVAIDYNGYNNDETRDAFCKTVEIYVAGDMAETVKLTRPFAQVNVGCTDEDWNAAVNSGITVATSQVTFVDAATKLNVLDGTVEGAQTVSYTAAAIPTETLKVDSNNDGTKEDFHYLSMSYILPNDGTTGSAKTVASASFVFKSIGNDITLSEGLQNIPLQRNYRTNIVGTFLTSAVNINVIVDSNFEGEYTVGPALINGVAYPSIQAAIDAATPGTVLEVVPGNYNEVLNLQNVANDITIQPFVMTRSASEEVVLSGVNCQRNGENLPTITFKNVTIDNSLATENWFTGTGKCAPCVGAWGGNLSFENVKFVVDGTDGKETGVMTWWTTSVGEMTFKNCTFEGKDNHAEARGMQIYGHYNIDVEGCTFTTAKRYSLKYVAQEGCVANLKNNIVKNANYFVEIGSEPYKGTKYTINYEGNTLYGADLYKEGYANAITTEVVTVNESNNTTIIADGLTLCNGVYSISNANGLFAFAKSVNVDGKTYSGKTVKLTADINLNNAEWTPVGQTGATQFLGTFDGDNHTISNLKINTTDESAHYSSGLFGWLNSAIVKNVNISNAEVAGHHNVGVIAGYMETSGCTIENCHVSNATISCTSVNSDANGDKCGGIVGHAGNAGVVVKDCSVSNSTISAGRDAGQVVGAALQVNVVNCSADNVTVTANGTSTGANINNAVIGRVL
ncbi:MAG: hypothetical protein PUD41_01455 [bacterium]|nr:hypothetical protein [bacterium]